jgi:hypothetical protein
VYSVTGDHRPGDKETQAVAALVEKHKGDSGLLDLAENLTALDEALDNLCKQVMPLLDMAVRPLHVRGVAYLLLTERSKAAVDAYLTVNPVYIPAPDTGDGDGNKKRRKKK